MTSYKYYAIREGNLVVIRQTRFKGMSPPHPWDVCLVARSFAEAREMSSVLSNRVDWSEEEKEINAKR